MYKKIDNSQFEFPDLQVFSQIWIIKENANTNINYNEC